MFFLITLAASVILAIPTWGLSVIIFFIVKRWCDKKAANAIIGAMKSSIRLIEGVELHHINRAAVRWAIETVGVEKNEAHLDGGHSFYTTIGTHPMINKGEVFSVYVSYLPRQGTKNTIEVFAVPGVRENILGIGQNGLFRDS